MSQRINCRRIGAVVVTVSAVAGMRGGSAALRVFQRGVMVASRSQLGLPA
jgi:hypothetical protein